MRILIISAFYPPNEIGGWEQLTSDINQRLISRRHATHVLTSTYNIKEPNHEPGVSRTLSLESNLYHYKPLDFFGHKRRLATNLRLLRNLINKFKPDIIFVHGMFNFSKAIPWLAEQMLPGRVVYYIANDWPYAPDTHTVYWKGSARCKYLRLIRKLVGVLPLYVIEQEKKLYQLKFEHVLCVSQAVKEDLARKARIPASAMKVVYNGVETDLFIPNQTFLRDNRWAPSLLYAGSLVEHKGVHTAIEALALLTEENEIKNISLTLVGSGHPDYVTYLHELVAEKRLSKYIHFRDRVPREEMPALLQEFNILIFPSTWDEPLARMMQEAMAAGLVVVGTVTGGSGELLVNGNTGLTFPAGDAAGLAKQIKHLYRKPDLHAKLSKNARNVVVKRFDINRMVDEIETYFNNLIM
jgi:glycogen synthase